ncbi:hypothetical protein [Methylobacterium variabile]|nr:hypothetical protein [Methylobacterium variabile]
MPMQVAKRSLLRVFTMGLSAPAFLVAPAAEMRVLRRGETIHQAWSNVGTHMARSLGSLTGEQRTDRRTG